MFTFGFVHPLGSLTVFKATGGGRIYVHSINVLTREISPFGTILDVTGGDIANGFFHINGVTGDGNIEDYHLLRNTDTGNGLTHVRYTNAHLTSTAGHVARIEVDRSGSTSGQTVVEIVGCRGLSAMSGVSSDLDPAKRPKVLINGPSSTERSRLIVRDSELATDTEIVNTASSMHYTENRIKNWVWGAGLQTDI